jgi:hypothetical protein
MFFSPAAVYILHHFYKKNNCFSPAAGCVKNVYILQHFDPKQNPKCVYLTPQKTQLFSPAAGFIWHQFKPHKTFLFFSSAAVYILHHFYQKKHYYLSAAGCLKNVYILHHFD